MKRKRSFFERLTGSVNMDEDEVFEDEEEAAYETETEESVESEGQLGVDVYETPQSIIIKAMIAGVTPESLDISLSREVITIRGHREAVDHVHENDYFLRELYWGSFSRTIILPQEIEMDEAEALEEHGLLTLTLPKIDKEKQRTLYVKSNQD
ncbi:MAG: Hsp20/alpha crystallin family protein [Candidatus Pacebacteria bacterium]|nr:Hsp20/alpha crystallin family protein [Candidatus Paceibacterota bacterium]